jgi:O-antigen ligase
MSFKNNSLSLLIAAAIFLAPINLFIKWGEAQAYVGGIFTDYLIQKFWLAEIPVILTILIWLVYLIRRQKIKILPFLKKNRWWLLALSALFVRQIFSPQPIIAGWYFLKMLELVFFARCLIDLWPKIHRALFRWALLLTIVFQAGLATYQFFQQQSLFAYHILGETQLTGSINIARAEFKTGEVILPYGTTAHPNILAGVVTILGIIWLQLGTRHKRSINIKYLSVVLIIVWILFITQSTSALLAFIIFLLLQIWPVLKLFSLQLAILIMIATPLALIFIPSHWQTESIFRRVFLNAHAVSVVASQPLLGTGLDQYTTKLKDIAGESSTQFIRFIQPVHNVPLLWLAETGLVGVILLGSVVGRLKLNKHAVWLLVLAPILSLDHYLLTQWAGGMLLVIALAVQLAQQQAKE